MKNCTKLNYLRTKNELLYKDDDFTKIKGHDYPKILGREDGILLFVTENRNPKARKDLHYLK